MASPWAVSTKLVPAHPPVIHIPAGFRPPTGFSPPGPSTYLPVGRLDLHAAMARTALTSLASHTLIQAQMAAAAASVDYCIDDGSTGFELSPDLQHLNGAERTALAGRIGAGLCDLYMISLGYVWRDQAIRLVRTRKPLADFVYEGPPTHGFGVAIAEAKGSTQRGTYSATQKIVDSAYHRQVEGHLGTTTAAGDVVHGYVVGLRAPLGQPGFLCVAETGVTPPISAPGGTSGGVQGSAQEGAQEGDRPPSDAPASAAVSLSTALGNFSTALWLAGKRSQSIRLRRLRDGRDKPAATVEALKALIEDSDGTYILGHTHGTFFPYTGIRFAVRIEPVRVLLKLLTEIHREDMERASVEMPIFPTTLGDSTNSTDFVQFPDGLAAFEISREEALLLEAALPPEPSLDPVHTARTRRKMREEYLMSTIDEVPVTVDDIEEIEKATFTYKQEGSA